MDSNDNGDDFDSFFTTKKIKTTGQQQFTKPADPLEDLFGLEEKASISKKGAVSTAKTNTSLIREEPEDDDLGFDPKKPKAVGKAQNLFDDLLGPLETKRPQTAGVTQRVTKAPISRQSTDTTTDTSNINQNANIRPKTSQGRRTSSNMNSDALSLFTRDKDTSKPPSTVGSPKTQKRGTTADWLGLAVELENEPKIKTAEVAAEIPKTPKITKTTPKETAEILTLKEHTETQKPQPTENPSAEEVDNEDTHLKLDSSVQNIMLMNTINVEAKQSYAALKNQEQQLVMASHMKQQERVLLDMQRKQNDLLQQQEHQFQQLFQQQFQRQQQIEDLIQQQQQRIQHHLQLMMTQPALQSVFPDLELQESFKNKKEAGFGEKEASVQSEITKEKEIALKFLQIESDNKRLELENLRLEELIANTKSNYEKEIELLERSYKKQIEVLEEHLSAMEKRFKTEIEELQVHFQAKIEILEQEKQNLKKSYEEEFSNLKQDHEDELRKLRKTHEEDIELLKEEHHRMLNNIRQAKMLEFAAIQENGSYLDYLKVASSNLKDLTGGLTELKENMQSKIELLQLEREKKLEQREKLVEDAEKRLKISEEMNEHDKQRLMDLVSSLELQMGNMSKEAAEENWQLRQKLAILDAEKLAFNKEKEFFREQLLRDEERIKELKELQLLETQRLHVELQEERSQLQMDKSKFEMEKRLHNQTDVVQKDRLEVEAAMKVAQDAARKADLERERFFKMQRQLEQQKRELSEKEHALNMREEELHQELISYRMAERVAQETQQRAKIAEQFYQNKLHLLQQRSNELNEKETNLSQERLLLSQDRLALHALKTKLTKQPKCSLCQLAQKNQEITQSLQGNTQLFKEDFPPVDTVGSKNFDFLSSDNVVERYLDANIADSMRRMQATSNFGLEWENFLDDDHKKMVQNEDFGVSKNSGIPRTDL